MPDNRQNGISEAERHDAEALSAPPARVIYEVVRRQGDEELARPLGSIAWSGVAGGVTIMVSVIAQGALRHKLPADLPMRDVIAELGYSVGFLMVILGRMQLFTEQTVVAVLPVTAEPSWRKLAVAARLWGIVLAANLIGTLGAAAIIVFVHLVSPEILRSMLEVSGSLLRKTPLDLLSYGVPAGFIMASIAWIKAGMEGEHFWIVFVLTYTIALGDFAHVVAGSAEAFLLLCAGQVGLGQAVGGIIAPALVGNVIGGTGLFALLAHAQVRREM